METRVKELIAIGASVAANCQPCLEHHVAQARESGAQDEEIKKAIAVGRIVQKGAAAKMDRFAAEISKDTECTACAGDKGDECRLT